MKVILLRDIAKLGKRGEVKEVANVYAINVLIKKGEATEATSAELAKWKQKEDSQKQKKENATHTFAELIQKLRNEKVIITGKKADAKGQLFASIKESDIADAIYKVSSLSIDPKQIILQGNIKSVGPHEVELKQGIQREKIIIEVK
ncbi:MAG: ribosomal protein [Candidatus Nomurabacteria bacterium]|nr:ribosomal protein [Candidatus Nomurabacteria bacterium]